MALLITDLVFKDLTEYNGGIKRENGGRESRHIL